MKKLIIPLVALLFAWTPVQAAPPDLSKITEATLMEGLTNLSVCMVTDLVGVEKLSELTKEAQAEPGPTSKEDIPHMYQDAKMMFQAMSMHAKGIDLVINALIQNNNASEANLEKVMEPLIKDTVSDMKAQLEPVVTYREFQEAFEPKLRHCSESLDKWVDKLPKNPAINP